MYELVSFVSRGKIRRKVLAELVEPNTPTILSRLLKTHRSTVSRTIIELEKKNLLKCLTPKERMGRYYETTPLGKKILKKVI